VLALRPATRWLIYANVACFVLERLLGWSFFAALALWPVGRLPAPGGFGVVPGFAPWQLFTSAFLHANLTHLFVNMFALWMFGPSVEETIGSPRFLALYLAAVLTGSLAQVIVVSTTASVAYPTVGASGGIFGVLLAFGRLFPRRIIVLLIPPIPMPAWLFVTLYGIFELVNGVLGTEAGVAHFAHLGGMLGAALVLHGARRPDPSSFQLT
jgi:membrane associated rhomboid family serine protease